MNRSTLLFSTQVMLIALVSILIIRCSSMPIEPTSGGDPWSPEQLMEPKELAQRISLGDNIPVIINIGPSGLIANAIDIGPGQEKGNIATMKKELQNLTKDTEVVIYCGCCPFKDCPNIRPAFTALNETGMNRPYLLNLSQNLRVDWISKGYPMAGK